ncbi:MAG: glycosyltransferase family 1 protein, partial [Pedosphaera sp.]|nr:glycosyltransferase family 1 protein [Pedosphaera sp.]
KASRPWAVWRTRRNFAAVLKQGNFDAVVYHGNWCLALLRNVAGSRANRKTILWLHGPLTGSSWQERFALGGHPDCLIANSRYTAESAGRFAPEVPLCSVRYAVPEPAKDNRAKVRSDVRKELGIPTDSVVILQVSRLDEWKGQRVLVAAAGLLQSKTHVEWRCLIAGGPQRPQEEVFYGELKAQAQRAGVVGKLQFLGQRGDVHRLMASADIFCQPNTAPEPFGIVFIEALYSGLPVVTSAMGGALEILDESCAMLLPPGQPDALSGALASLIENGAERNRLGAGGPERARKLCCPKRVLKQLYSVLSSAK